MKRLELENIFEQFLNSEKWLANFYDEYPHCFAVFHYAPTPAMGRWVKVVIPMQPGHNRYPDLNQEWLGKIMTDNYGLITVKYKPTKHGFTQFTSWLYALVNDPERLIVVDDLHLAKEMGI